MKKTLVFLFFILISFNSFSQGEDNKFSIGWYHLLPGAKTKILTVYDNSAKTNPGISYATDEVLLVFEIKGKFAYAIDIDGRIVLIDNLDKLKKIETEGRVVKMLKTIDISLSKKLGKDNNVWLVGFNSATNSAKILLANGSIAEIPKDSYIDIREFFEKIGNQNLFYETKEY